MPRTRRFLPLPATTKPMISAWSPGPDSARTEKLTIRLPSATIVNVAVLVPMLFDAPIVTTEVPEMIGVPVIAPVVVLSVRPAGSPTALKLVGNPDAVITYVGNGWPTVAVMFVALVIVGATGAGATVTVNRPVPLPAELVAVSVATKVPAAVGVPVMAPVDVLSVR